MEKKKIKEKISLITNSCSRKTRYQSCGLALLNTFYAQKHIPAGDMEEFLAQRHLKVPEEVRAGGGIVAGFT